MNVYVECLCKLIIVAILENATTEYSSEYSDAPTEESSESLYMCVRVSVCAFAR